MERRLFHSLFATVRRREFNISRIDADVNFPLAQKDQKIGMNAFANKQKPTWSHS